MHARQARAAGRPVDFQLGQHSSPVGAVAYQCHIAARMDCCGNALDYALLRQPLPCINHTENRAVESSCLRSNFAARCGESRGQGIDLG